MFGPLLPCQPYLARSLLEVEDPLVEDGVGHLHGLRLVLETSGYHAAAEIFPTGHTCSKLVFLVDLFCPLEDHGFDSFLDRLDCLFGALQLV